MKANIHPTYHKEVKVTCACGHTFLTGSTQEKISTEICSNCHPFYTGKQNLVDTAGRVERFQKIMDSHAKKAAAKKTAKSKKPVADVAETKDNVAVLKEIKKEITTGEK